LTIITAVHDDNTMNIVLGIVIVVVVVIIII